MSRIEEYRESMNSKAAQNGVVRRRDELCILTGMSFSEEWVGRWSLGLGSGC
ncbi:hypothetical protein GBA52_001318 [Prunus armeniaca]|nr:hypothetical protein GBA52_001318 [Prunus armeniaca]